MQRNATLRKHRNATQRNASSTSRSTQRNATCRNAPFRTAMQRKHERKKVRRWELQKLVSNTLGLTKFVQWSNHFNNLKKFSYKIYN